MLERLQRNPMYQVAAILVLALTLTSVGRADFMLWNDEQLTVNTSHSRGDLYDQSLATVISGGWVGNLYAFNSSTANISRYCQMLCMMR